MTHPTTATTAKACPMTSVLDLATNTAKAELGIAATAKSVTTSATLSTSITENGKKKTVAVDASVTLGTKITEEDAVEGCGCTGGCK
jgi:hypothetical protein